MGTQPVAILAGTIAVAALAAGGSVRSEHTQPPAGQAPTLRAETTLVEFTIVATDGHGRPVTDLKSDEISILEDGALRSVAFFRFEGATGGGAGSDGAAPAQPEPLPPGIFTNRAEYSPGPPRNLTAVVFDTINTPPQAQVVVAAEIVRFLKSIPAESRLGLYRLGRRTAVLHDFTEDAAALRARLATDSVQVDMLKDDQGGDFAGLSQATTADRARAMGQAAESEARMLAGRTDAVRDERLSATLAGLEALGNHLAGVPGRKNLVWISHGMPIVAFTGGFINRYDERIKKTAERLASQGITVYAVDARGLEPPDLQTSSLASRSGRGGPPARPRSLDAQVIGEGRARASMDILTSLTGGRLLLFTNDPTEGVTAAAQDIRGSYSTGVLRHAGSGRQVASRRREGLAPRRRPSSSTGLRRVRLRAGVLGGLERGSLAERRVRAARLDRHPLRRPLRARGRHSARAAAGHRR